MSTGDATFREVCANYEEVSTWLTDYCRSQDRPFYIVQDLSDRLLTIPVIKFEFLKPEDLSISKTYLYCDPPSLN